MDRKTLDKVAHLARVNLSDQEADAMVQQLSQALHHFEQIAGVDTTGVQPLVTPVEMPAAWRPDAVQVETTAEQIVANAPARQGLLFTVPPVV